MCHEERATVTTLANNLRQADLYILIYKTANWNMLQWTQIRQMQTHHGQSTYDIAVEHVLI